MYINCLTFFQINVNQSKFIKYNGLYYIKVIYRSIKLMLTKILVIFSYFRPTSEVKVKMACSIIEEFPFLKDEEGLGYVCKINYTIKIL